MMQIDQLVRLEFRLAMGSVAEFGEVGAVPPLLNTKPHPTIS